MDQNGSRIGRSRVVPGCLLGLLLALASPFLLVMEMFVPMPLVMFPAAGILWLHHWAGRHVSMFAMLMLLLSGEILMGPGYMLIAFFAIVLPLVLVMRQWRRPFFYQMKFGLAAFGAGMVAAVVVMYFAFGRDMIAKLLGQFPAALRMLPEENINLLIQSVGSSLGKTFSAEEFFLFFEQRIDDMILLFQIRLPGMLFSGAIITAVLCVVMNSRALARAHLSGKGCYVPPSRWYLPESTTGGLLLIGVIAYLIAVSKAKPGLTVYQTVYDIAVWAFCFQGMASVARRVGETPGHRRAQLGLPMFMIVMSLFGASSYFAIYGLASALLGSRGAIRLYLERKRENNSNEND